MSKPRKIKIIISDEVRGLLAEVDSELKSRGARDYDLCEIIEQLLVSESAKTILDDFVNKHTPESYKITKLLDTPGEREKILELLQDKNFGLTDSHANANNAQV